MQQDLTPDETLEDEELQLRQLLDRVMDAPLQPLRDVTQRLDVQMALCSEQMSKCVTRINGVAAELKALDTSVNERGDDALEAAREGQHALSEAIEQVGTKVTDIAGSVSTLGAQQADLLDRLKEQTQNMAALSAVMAGIHQSQKDFVDQWRARDAATSAQLMQLQAEGQQQVARTGDELAATRSSLEARVAGVEKWQQRLAWIAGSTLVAALVALGTVVARLM